MILQLRLIQVGWLSNQPAYEENPFQPWWLFITLKYDTIHSFCTSCQIGVAIDPHEWLETQEKRAQLAYIPMWKALETCQMFSHSTQCKHPNLIIPAWAHSHPHGVLHGIHLHPGMAWAHVGSPPHTQMHIWSGFSSVSYNSRISLWKWLCSVDGGYIRWRKHYVNKVLSFPLDLVLRFLSFTVIELSLFSYSKKMQISIASVSEAHSLWVFLFCILLDYLPLTSFCTDIFLCL